MTDSVTSIHLILHFLCVQFDASLIHSIGKDVKVFDTKLITARSIGIIDVIGTITTSNEGGSVQESTHAILTDALS